MMTEVTYYRQMFLQNSAVPKHSLQSQNLALKASLKFPPKPKVFTSTSDVAPKAKRSSSKQIIAFKQTICNPSANFGFYTLTV